MRLELSVQVMASFADSSRTDPTYRKPWRPQRGVWADRTLAVHYLIDPPGQHSDRLSQPVLADPERKEELFEKNLAWMNRHVRLPWRSP